MHNYRQGTLAFLNFDMRHFSPPPPAPSRAPIGGWYGIDADTPCMDILQSGGLTYFLFEDNMNDQNIYFATI